MAGHFQPVAESGNYRMSYFSSGLVMPVQSKAMEVINKESCRWGLKQGVLALPETTSSLLKKKKKGKKKSGFADSKEFVQNEVFCRNTSISSQCVKKTHI